MSVFWDTVYSRL